MNNLKVINIKTDNRWKANKENCIYIGRPSILSNPYSSKTSNLKDTIKVSTTEQSLNLFLDYFKKDYHKLEPEINRIMKLMDKYDNVYLGCFCKPKNCHGDIIRNHIMMKKNKDKMAL